MAMLDLKKDLRSLYSAPHEPAVVTVPPMSFLMVDGKGDPNTSQDYAHAIEALYGMAYTLKFMIKKESGLDYSVMPLEGLWWADDPTAFLKGAKEEWHWTAMIMQPEQVTEAHVARAREDLRKKKDPAALPKLRYERFEEGLCAQIMHIGPYSEEGSNIMRLHAFIEEKGLKLRGKHHEIYLGDPRRSAPEKLRTIIRQPMERA